MTTPLTHIALRTFVLILSEVICTHPTVASDELSLPSRPSSVRISVASHERIPIATLLAHPDRYPMRDIRITGTITAMQTEIIPNRMICGGAYEQTTLMLVDESGQIEVLDRGACGWNISALKAPMVKVGEQVDLLVQIMVTKDPESHEAVLETTIRFLDRIRF